MFSQMGRLYVIMRQDSFPQYDSDCNLKRSFSSINEYFVVGKPKGHPIHGK